MFTFIDHSCTAKYRYKAIGGCHLSQWHFKELGTKEDQDNVKNLPVINLKPLLNLKNSDIIYDLPHPAFIKRKKNKQNSGIESVNDNDKDKDNYNDTDTESMFKFLDSTQSDHTYYGNGLYLYTSEDGYNWNIKSERPIISGMKEGHYDYLYFCSTFQSHPNCFYDPFKHEYLLYLRSNLNGGLKHIQVARSINLTNWNPLEFVNFNPTFDLSNDNYESLNPMVYPDISNKHPIYISFPVFHRKKAKTTDDSFIGLGFSEDGLNWKICGDLIKPVLTKDQTSSALVYGLIKSDDGQEFYFYEHRNRSRNIKNQSNSIWKHSIRIDGFTSISAGNVEGFIQTREIEFGTQIQLNYHTKINGYLHLEFMNLTHDVVANQKNIIGDNINYIIDVPEILNYKKGYLRMILKDIEIYAINI
jgi:hypothetical protein